MFLQKFLTAGHGVFLKTCSAAGHVDTKTSANPHFCRSVFTVNFKCYPFETRIKKNCLLLNRGFFLYHDQQAEMIRHKLFANITKNQTYNLVLFHKKVVFQVALISTSKKIQECAKIILDNMGNNEEKNRYFIEINSYCTQPSLPRRENTTSQSTDDDISKV